jgi:hypothetical protein
MTESNQNSNPNSNSWLHITAPAAAAGTVASVVTYTLFIQGTGAAATGTGWLVDGAGMVAAAGTRWLAGDIPATSVRILGRICSEGTAASIRSGGHWTSLGLAAAVGGTTALTVSLGTRLIEATVEYGGAAATRVAEAYLRLKQEPGSVLDISGIELNLIENEEGDWIIMDIAL